MTAAKRIARFVAALVPSVCLSAPVVVSPAPMPEFADTEVSTNLAVSVGGGLGGVGGMIMAVPITATVYTLVHEWVQKKKELTKPKKS